jgi:hypothetical protein
LDLDTRPVLKHQPVRGIRLREASQDQDNGKKGNLLTTPDFPLPRHPGCPHIPAEAIDGQDSELAIKEIKQLDRKWCPVPFFRRVEVPDPRGRTDRTGQPIKRVTLMIEPAEAAIVRRIYEMYLAGAGYTRLAKGLNAEGVPGPWSRSWDGSAIREILRNDVYRGARVYGRIRKVKTAQGTRSKRSRPETARTIKEGTHPAIIDPALWERVKTKREAVAKAYEGYERNFGATKSLRTRFLLTGLLKCGVCGGNFAARVAQTRRGKGRYYYYGCAFRARRGSAVCENSTLLPQDAIEREVLEILQEAVLTPATLDRLLAVVNAKLRARAQVSRPRITELRRALTLVEREIANYTRAIGKGDFSSLEQALTAAEQPRAGLQAELAKLNGNQPSAVIQLTPAALERHLEGMTEKLRSGVNGKVREAIQQSVVRILVSVDEAVTLETKPDGLLGVEGIHVRLDGGEEGGLIQQSFHSSSDRRWAASMAS